MSDVDRRPVKGLIDAILRLITGAPVTAHDRIQAEIVKRAKKTGPAGGKSAR